MNWIDESFQRYGHSKLYKTADGGDHMDLVKPEIEIRSADLENPTLLPNMRWIG